MSSDSARRRMFVHTVNRARERYGISITESEWRDLSMKIRATMRRRRPDRGPALSAWHVADQPPDRSIWRVLHDGQILRVIYDHSFDAVVTALPPTD